MHLLRQLGWNRELNSRPFWGWEFFISCSGYNIMAAFHECAANLKLNSIGGLKLWIM